MRKKIVKKKTGRSICLPKIGRHLTGHNEMVAQGRRVGGSAGRILDDGSIDLRDRNLISVVQDGELLGRLHPALPGVTGRDALGDEILPPALTEIEVVPDARVEAREEGDGIIAYHARTSGGVSSTEETRGNRGRTVSTVWRGPFIMAP